MLKSSVGKMRLFLPALCWMWVACGDTAEVCDNGVDDDGNGLADCDDAACFDSCTTTQGDVEVCDDGLDNDRDWLIDCDDRDCASSCDADGDGFVAVERGGLDCDDTNLGVHPDVPEVPYNGLDDDCNPSTADDDIDGDGFALADDCDDDAPNTYPGAPEVCGDRAINDCNSPDAAPSRSACFTHRSVSTADVTFVGTAPDAFTGFDVGAAGDTNGDGYDDLLIGAYGESANSGSTYLVHTRPNVELERVVDLSTAAAKWVGESEDDWSGRAVAGGHDLAGTGGTHAVIGAWYDDGSGNNAGAVYVVGTAANGTVELTDARAKLFGEDRVDYAGVDVASPGDVTGDGFADLLVGAEQNDSFGLNNPGAAYLVPGPLQGQIQLSDNDTFYRFLGSQANQRVGCKVASAGFVDDDAFPDILISACLANIGTKTNAGQVYLYTSELLQQHAPGDFLLVADDGNDDEPQREPSGAFGGFADGDIAGIDLSGAGDVDGDGRDEIVIGAAYNDDAGIDAGAVYVSLDPLTNMQTPEITILGERAGDLFGISVAGVGDVDGDGFDDIAVGAIGYDHPDGSADDAGALYLFFGPLMAGFDGLIDLSELDQGTLETRVIRLRGESAFDLVGQSVAAAGDTNGDGFSDVLVGAYGRDGGAPSSGAAYLFTFDP